MAKNKLLNAELWKKAYLLEFRQGERLTDAFTFSVPPESEEFVFPQRKNETKTFGGAVVADYGNDLVQINLSGSTINQELKLIYKSKLGTTEMTGEQEAFYLRDLLRKWGSKDYLSSNMFKTKKVYLYALNGNGINTKNKNKWWKIYVGELNISRNKDKPFCYNYKFTAIAEPEVLPESKYKKLLTFNKSLYEWVNSAIGSMYDVLGLIEDFGGGLIKEIHDYISEANNCLDSFNAALERYTDVINGLITETTSIVTDTVGLGDKVLYSATRYYPSLASDLWNSCLNVKEAFKNIYDSLNNLDETLNVEVLYDKNTSKQDITDVFSTLGHKGIISANKVVTLVNKNLNNFGVVSVPGGENQNDYLIMVYGFKEVKISDAETSWDQIAQDYYGDASLSSVIASYNNLPTEKKLIAGENILIPKLNYDESQLMQNEVYNLPDIKDNYGKDLIIENKDFAVSNGDLKIIQGIDNLSQALLNRYVTIMGARIRHEVYGIQTTIGDSLNVTSSLIQASIHQTTIEDPRVEAVEDISFEGMGDGLNVQVIYTDNNGLKRDMGGLI